MRVLFTSTRGAGHFTPLIPYIEACLRGGHDVSVAAAAELANTVAATGATFRPFDHPGDEKLRPIWDRVTTASFDEANEIVIGQIFAGIDARESLPRLERTFVDWKPDVVVRETAEFGAAVLADKFEVPHVRIAISLSSFESLSLRAAAAPIDALRRSAGLGSDPRGERLQGRAYFTVVPKSLEYPAVTEQPGTRRFRESRVGSRAEPLPAWWQDEHAPLVYVTFGSVAGSMPMARAAYRAALEALSDLPVRGLLTVGRGAPPNSLGTIPPNVRVEEWVAHYQVLEHASLVVSHGGSGTVLGTLAAGTPQIVVPMFADQPYNAERLVATGAGVAVPLGEKLAERLREAVLHVLENDAPRQAAQRLAAEMSAHAPIEAAVDALERIARGDEA